MLFTEHLGIIAQTKAFNRWRGGALMKHSSPCTSDIFKTRPRRILAKQHGPKNNPQRLLIQERHLS